MKLAFALAGLEMRVDLVWRKQKRNALVAGVGNKLASASGAAASSKPALTGNPFTVPFDFGPNVT